MTSKHVEKVRAFNALMLTWAGWQRSHPAPPRTDYSMPTRNHIMPEYRMELADRTPKN